jgi:predicted GH43/DUF377 family glycosyl hydrolase
MNLKNNILPVFFGILASCSVPDKSKLPSWAMGPFVRPEGVNPVISPDPRSKFFCPMTQDSVGWEESDTFNPAAAVKDDKICVLYRAEDNSAIGIGKRTSRIGLAESADGVTMKRSPEPVLYPAEDDFKDIDWPGGCEDPRVAMTEDGMYVMFYTSWNRKRPRLSVATSTDLVHWQKHGYVFRDSHNGRFNDMACKAGTMITRLDGDRQVIAKINGKYFMYWGEHAVCTATSDDLIHWIPVLDDQGELLKVIAPRKGHFDSLLTECGPPAILTKDGILLMYNGKNAKGENGDLRYAAGSYCAGQVLFSKDDPYRVIDRLDEPFFHPEADFEKSGQYIDGTVFLEGLAYFQKKWFLYYGCADSQVGVAIWQPK